MNGTADAEQVGDDEFTVPSFAGAGPVTLAHRRWMSSDNEELSAKARRFLAQAHRNEFRGPRIGRISVSSIGYCPRRQTFQTLGAPESPPPNAKSHVIMRMGTWGHLRWQAEGLTAGWLKQAEVWVTSTFRGKPRVFVDGDPRMALDLPIAGRMDGILNITPAHGFELKTTNYRTFDNIRTRGAIPRWHVLQANAYMALARLAKMSLVYETRDWGDYHEVVIEPDVAALNEIRSTVTSIREHVWKGTLPPVLDDCSWQQGPVYAQCPYRHVCLKVDDIADLRHG